MKFFIDELGASSSEEDPDTNSFSNSEPEFKLNKKLEGKLCAI